MPIINDLPRTEIFPVLRCPTAVTLSGFHPSLQSGEQRSQPQLLGLKAKHIQKPSVLFSITVK